MAVAVWYPSDVQQLRRVQLTAWLVTLPEGMANLAQRLVSLMGRLTRVPHERGSLFWEGAVTMTPRPSTRHIPRKAPEKSGQVGK